ncbi:hypothetical protein CYY_008896 [Polysphondylium violaceum]|uniref:CENP-V/GFA domain-containing protein n=1 Tax=Polysphondylium violaceum TaxID=133409 RepID=A0A8J4PMC4_9MYCE|nr:hypothetical protein CYY_008896 [Polysphondylium violaceum]
MKRETIGACHCTTCLKWSSGPWFAIFCKDVNITKGQELVKKYHSSEWADRFFCLECGSNLYFQEINTKDYYVSAFTLDDLDENNTTFDNQVFIDEKPSFYSFSNETKTMTKDQVYQFYKNNKIMK